MKYNNLEENERIELKDHRKWLTQLATYFKGEGLGERLNQDDERAFRLLEGESEESPAEFLAESRTEFKKILETAEAKAA